MRKLSERAGINTLGINALKRLILRGTDREESSDIRLAINFLIEKNKKIAEENKLCVKQFQRKSL